MWTQAHRERYRQVGGAYQTYEAFIFLELTFLELHTRLMYISFTDILPMTATWTERLRHSTRGDVSLALICVEGGANSRKEELFTVLIEYPKSFQLVPDGVSSAKANFTSILRTASFSSESAFSSPARRGASGKL
jgi:hypothetical protein